MHAVGAADHRRQTVLEGAVADGLSELREVRKNEVARLAHLQRLRGVDHVRRGHAEVQPPRRWTDLFGHRRGERNDVVLCGLFDLFDAGDVEAAAFADVAGGLGGNNPGGRHGFGSGRFDQQPGFIAALVAPDATHFRVRVACNHPTSSRSRGICNPLTLPRTVAESDPLLKRSVATRCTSSGVTRLDSRQRLVHIEQPIEIDHLTRQIRHAARRALETQHQAALQVILGCAEAPPREPATP